VALRAHGLRDVFIVDDNLIGYKKAIKAVLRDVIAWQEAHGYPLTFFTEASLDLAEDDALMRLMVEAGISAVFVGIESPNEAALRETSRLDPADAPGYGTNVVPLRMRREELRDGYLRLMADVYTPEAYLGRLDSLYIEGRLTTPHSRVRYWQRHPWERLRSSALFLVQATGLYVRLMRRIPDATLRREYRRRLWRLIKARREPEVLHIYAIRCAMHYHFHTLIRHMAGGEGPIVNSLCARTITLAGCTDDGGPPLPEAWIRGQVRASGGLADHACRVEAV
jgi:hypothetical protein